MLIGQTLGSYQVLEKLGEGGMGEVYRARDTRLKRDVALKVLRAHRLQDAAAEARFAREAKTVAALSHPNIVAIHDVGTADGTVYAVMELLDGETLRARLTQSPIPWRKALPIALQVADGVWTDRGTGTAHYAVAGNGTVVYAPGGNTVEQRRLVWVDRRGRVQPLPAEPNVYGGLRLSRDGQRLAVEILNNIWVYDLAAGTLGPVSSRGVNQTPAWAPDGRHVAFSSSAGFADAKLCWTDVETDAQPEPLTREGSVQFPGSWTPDGLTLGYVEILGSPAGTEFGWDIWLLRRGATTSRSPLVRTKANEDQPMFSPDGRTLAYVSDEGGQRQVYVRPFPEPGKRTQISAAGGTEPVWSRRGDELFFRNGQQYFSVPMVAGDSSRHGRSALMFEGTFVVQGDFPGAPSYGVAADGQRFIMVQRLADAPRPTRLDVVLNWVKDLESRTQPAGKR